MKRLDGRFFLVVLAAVMVLLSVSATRSWAGRGEGRGEGHLEGPAILGSLEVIPYNQTPTCAESDNCPEEFPNQCNPSCGTSAYYCASARFLGVCNNPETGNSTVDILMGHPNPYSTDDYEQYCGTAIVMTMPLNQIKQQDLVGYIIGNYGPPGCKSVIGGEEIGILGTHNFERLPEDSGGAFSADVTILYHVPYYSPK